MKTTYQYANDQVVEDSVVCVVMSGPVKTAWSVNHGCVPLGEELTITKAEGNVIFELDGKPAMEVMREYLNPDEVKDWGKAVVNLGLGFKASEDMQDYDDYLIRIMPAKDDTTGAVSLPTEVTVGTPVWMTRRDKEKIATGVEHIADDITAQLNGSPPKFVLQFDCAGRGKMVFREQEKLDLLDDLQRRVGPDVPWLGLYTYGEIGPVGNTDCFHNYTLVLLAIQ
jgi:small ligand-binding sensory domain FIST